MVRCSKQEVFQEPTPYSFEGCSSQARCGQESRAPTTPWGENSNYGSKYVRLLLMQSKNWNKNERREVALLALIPLSCAAVMTASIFFLLNPTGVFFFPIVFFFITVCAFATEALGVVPLLLVFRHMKWQSAPHFAAAGYLGVVLPWVIPTLMSETLRQNGLSANGVPSLFNWSSIRDALAFLSFPGALSAVGSVAFWVLCVRGRE